MTSGTSPRRTGAALLVGLAIGVLLLGLGLLAVPLLVVSAVAGGASGSTGFCGPALPVQAALASGPLAQQQARNAQLIDQVALARGLPGSATLIALMTALTESDLVNVNYGDRDSLGLFQQRPSTGWGSPQQILDPQYAAQAFFGGTGPPGNPGLVDVTGWPGLPPGQVAQLVQRSAYPDRYATQQDAARQVAAAAGIDLTRPGNPYAGRAGTPDGPAAGGTAADAAGAAGPAGDALVSCLPGAGGPLAEQVLAAAQQWLGTPYAWGGGTPAGPSAGFGRGAGTVGFDCSGLTLYAYAQVGIALPHKASDQAKMGTRIAREAGLAALQPGDLVFFALDPVRGIGVHHVGIYLGNGMMIDAPNTGSVVRIEPVWLDTYSGASRWST